MTPCPCSECHTLRRVVLTGGPGAGKTAVLELIRQAFCDHVRVLPEAAGIVLGGGFPRNGEVEVRRAAQRAIYHVQRELEAMTDGVNAALVLCDRGTVDGGAYWAGPGDLWTAVGSSRRDEMARYHTVIHLRTPKSTAWYTRRNPLRLETAGEAAVIDARIAELWREHPRRFVVDASQHFLDKAEQAVDIVRNEIPECCRQHVGLVGGVRGARETAPSLP